MFRSIVSSAAFVVLASVGQTQAAPSYTYDDGLVHTIDELPSSPANVVSLYDGPGPSSTTFKVIPSDNVLGEVQSHDTSVVEISGGRVSSIMAFGSTEVSMSGGRLHGIQVRSSAQMDFSGGVIEDDFRLSGGLNMSDGTILGGLYCYGTRETNITGGVVARLEPIGTGAVNLSGGTIVFLRMGKTAELNVYGRDLEWSGISGEGLSGFWGDGTEFYIPIGLSGNDASTINLHEIPEPSTLILLTTGTLGLLACGWRRR